MNVFNKRHGNLPAGYTVLCVQSFGLIVVQEEKPLGVQNKKSSSSGKQKNHSSRFWYLLRTRGHFHPVGFDLTARDQKWRGNQNH